MSRSHRRLGMKAVTANPRRSRAAIRACGRSWLLIEFARERARVDGSYDTRTSIQLAESRPQQRRHALPRHDLPNRGAG